MVFTKPSINGIVFLNNSVKLHSPTLKELKHIDVSKRLLSFLFSFRIIFFWYFWHRYYVVESVIFRMSLVALLDMHLFESLETIYQIILTLLTEYFL